MQVQQRTYSPLAVAALFIAGLVLLAAFAGWSRFGTDILLSAAASGLSWCF
jgi:hypothetical protein